MRRAPSGPHQPSDASAAHQVSVCPSRKVRVTGCQSPGSPGPPHGQPAGRVDRGVRVLPVGPGPAARLERHHERQPGLGQPGAEPVLVPVGAVRRHRPEREPRRLARTARSAPICSFVRNPGSLFPLREVPGRGVRHRVHRVVHPLVSPHRGDRDHPVVGLAVPAQPLPAHVRGRRAVLAVTRVIDDQHPAAVRRGQRIRPQQLQPAGVDPLRVPHRFGQEELQPLHRRQLRPVTGSAPARHVSVLFRSRGTSSPARYSRNPRRCATCVNRSSKPGRVLFQRTRRRRARYRLGHRPSPASNSSGNPLPGYLTSLDPTDYR